MASGDAQRVWFPEMIEQLRAQWREGMPLDALAGLRDDLDAMLQQIRLERKIRPGILKCPHCGHVGRGMAPHVSVRAMIVSVARFGIAPSEQVYALEKAWAAHRKQAGLDLYGKVAADGEGLGCEHPPVRPARTR
jgi:hypothetical protein